MARNVAIQILRGVAANIPALNVGEFYFATDTNTLYLGTSGSPVVVNGGGASLNKGTTTINFGAFPGVSDASVAIIGQSSILLTSFVTAELIPIATSDHTADEHRVEPIGIYAGNIVAGTGFTIYGASQNKAGGYDCPRVYGAWSIAWAWS